MIWSTEPSAAFREPGSYSFRCLTRENETMHAATQEFSLASNTPNMGAEGSVVAPASELIPKMAGGRKLVGCRSRLAALFVAFSASLVIAPNLVGSQTPRATTATVMPAYALGALDKIRLTVLEWRPS